MSILFSKNNFILIFILIFIILFDWETLRPNKFEDLRTYLNFMGNGTVNTQFLSSPFTYLFRENIFLILLLYLNNIFNDSHIVILFIKICSGIILYSALSKYNLPPYVSILLFCPIFIDFLDAQLRNSLACAFAIAGISTESHKRKILYFFFGSFIHLASLIIPLVYFFKFFHIKEFQFNFFKILKAFILTLTLGFFYLLFLFLLDDQRFHMYGANNSKISIGYITFGLLLSANCIFNYKQDNFYSLTIGLTILVASFSGAYYTRYIAIFWPLILLEISKNGWKTINYLIFASYTAYSFFMNFVDI